MAANSGLVFMVGNKNISSYCGLVGFLLLCV